jgi:hypothetical protein
VAQRWTSLTELECSRVKKKYSKKPKTPQHGAATNLANYCCDELIIEEQLKIKFKIPDAMLLKTRRTATGEIKPKEGFN